MHNLTVKHHFNQLVTVISSDNKYFKYPVIGVLKTYEQGVDLTGLVYVFRELYADGSLSAPCEMSNVIFTNKLKK